ncbi:hypothetical protein Vadar_014269 [Vaccinium darrowii]|uniref:Uncharacterized protein n=1 Tax=Vaccinium darrowii TaxID=229202 RepID=A0ACB7XQZ6_9ERIC|nr:hypothetical protein Vadar_014269 [Vaccinium darrowii]
MTLLNRRALSTCSPSSSIPSLISLCKTLRNLEQIHTQIIRKGSEQDHFLITLFISALTSLSPNTTTISYASTVFDRVSQPNIYLYNTLIKFHSHHSSLCHSLSVFLRMTRLCVVPDKYTFPLLVKSCSKSLALNLGRGIHGMTVKYGCDNNLYVGSSFVDFYGKCREIKCAREVFDGMHERNEVSWTSLVVGYVNVGDVVEAKKVFDQMPKRNVCSWNVMISGFVRIGDLKSARKLLDEMPDKNVVSFTAMIDGYAKAGDMASARDLFEKCPDRDVVSWSALLSGYAQNGQPTNAVKLFLEMLSWNVKPDEFILVNLMSACSQIGSLELAKWVDSYVNQQSSLDLQRTHVVAALIDMNAKCGNMGRAAMLFEEMPKRDLISFCSMMQGLSIHGCSAQAVSLFGRMINEGHTPDGVAFTVILTACSRAGLVEHGCRLFDSMINKYSLVPSTDHYACMVDLLSRSGKLRPAYELLNSMPVEPHAGAWGALLGACKLHGDIEIGKEIASRLFKLEPQNASNYVLLSNIYAATDRWLDVSVLLFSLFDKVSNWSQWLTELFRIDTKDQHANKDDVMQGPKHFQLLNHLSDLLMLPDRDECCPDPVPGAVLEAMNAEICRRPRVVLRGLIEVKPGMASFWRTLFVALVVGFEATNIAARFDYGNAVAKSLLFFEAQRSGKLPFHQRVKWRADSGLRDGFLQGVDLVGGYYDAGDHVKFGLPMAFSVTMLSWGAIDFREEIVGQKQMVHTLDAIKWGTDYFIKAHPHPNILWGQVGDSESDHYCWERAEDMSTPRTAYKLDPRNPGSDLAAETAAALASASLAFNRHNSSYSALLLLHSKQLFSFADTFRGLYHDSIKCAKQSYKSSGYSDELLWAAAWLFRATKDVYYLKYLADNAASMGGTVRAVKEFSWDTKYAGVQILLSKADYMLGKNPMSVSYVVGYGKKYPIHVHHRGASIASVSVLHSSVGCMQGFDTWYRRPSANPNVIHGALVGGPTKNDNFSDDRTNYEQTEPTISATAPLVGLFSKLQSITAGNSGSYHPVSSTPQQTAPILFTFQAAPARRSFRFRVTTDHHFRQGFDTQSRSDDIRIVMDLRIARVGNITFEELVTILNGEEMRKNRASNVAASSNLSSSVFVATPQASASASANPPMKFPHQQGASSSFSQIPQHQGLFESSQYAPQMAVMPQQSSSMYVAPYPQPYNNFKPNNRPKGFRN